MPSVGLHVQNPVKAGAIRASVDLSAVANTDWNNLSSSDFIDTCTGLACPAGLKFEWIGVTNEGSDSMFLKYRARTLASDPTANEMRIGQIFIDDVLTLRDEVTTIAYQKADASDAVYILAGFSAR